MFDDDFVENQLALGKIEPVRGTLWAEKYVPGKEKVRVDGYGTIYSTGTTESGLVLVSADNEEASNVKAALFVVRAIGENPAVWSVRGHDRTSVWENKAKTDVTWDTSWEGQAVQEGTVVAIRPSTGERQTRASSYMQIRYDELVAVGVPFEESCDIPMLPAPGWLIIEKDEVATETASGLYKGEGIYATQGWAYFGTVVGIPRDSGADYQELLGRRVAFPSFAGAGATEYIDFDGGTYRAVPLFDVWGVIDED